MKQNTRKKAPRKGAFFVFIATNYKNMFLLTTFTERMKVTVDQMTSEH